MPCSAPSSRRTSHSPSCTPAERPRTPSGAPAQAAAAGRAVAGAGKAWARQRHEASQLPPSLLLSAGLCPTAAATATAAVAANAAAGGSSSCTQPTSRATTSSSLRCTSDWARSRACGQAGSKKWQQPAAHVECPDACSTRKCVQLVLTAEAAPGHARMLMSCCAACTHLLGQVDAVYRLVVLLGQCTVPPTQLSQLSGLLSHRLRAGEPCGMLATC